MKNRFNLNEQEKNRIRGLHNIKIITEDSFDNDDTDAVLEECGIQLGRGLFLDYRVPGPCKKFMLASTTDRASGAQKFKLMNGCMDAAYDEIFGDDVSEEEGTEFVNFLVDKALKFKSCVENKGVDVEVLIDELVQEYKG